MAVSPLVMPGVEGVKADHVQAMLGNGAAVELQHLVHVLIMAPREHEVADAAARVVDAVLGAEKRVAVVRVLLGCC